MNNDEFIEIVFTASIKIRRNEDLMESDAEGDVDQAVQNVIGHTGAEVIETELV